MLPEIMFSVALIALAVLDIRTRLLPNRVTVALFATGLLVRLVLGGSVAVGWGLVGSLVGLGVLFIPFALRWMGGGDVKLAMAMGAWLGPQATLFAVLTGIALGGLVSLLFLVKGGPAFRSEVFQTFKLALFTMTLPAVPANRPRGKLVPLGLPLAVAGIGTLLYVGGFHV